MCLSLKLVLSARCFTWLISNIRLDYGSELEGVICDSLLSRRDLRLKVFSGIGFKVEDYCRVGISLGLGSQIGVLQKEYGRRTYERQILGIIDFRCSVEIKRNFVRRCRHKGLLINRSIDLLYWLI